MNQLNNFLQELVSHKGETLYLTPNENPQVKASSGDIHISQAPMQGPVINSLIFSLMPDDVKKELPNQDEVKFVHSHELGNFAFSVKKSPAGFSVSISPSAPSPEEAPPAATQPQQPELETSVNSPAQSTSTLPPVADRHKPSSALEDIIEDLNTYQPPQNAESDVDSSPEIAQAAAMVEVSTPSVPDQEPQALPIVEPIIETFEPAIQKTPVQNNIPTQQVPQPAIQQQPAPPPPVVPAAVSADPQAQVKMDGLFKKMADAGASDLHMSVSTPPMIRMDGKMAKLDESLPALTADSIRALLNSIMPQKNIEEFAKRNDTDFAYEITGLARFRANIFMDRKGMGGVFRIIPSDIMTAEDLSLSKHIMDLCDLSKGLVVVTGPTGSGKSTTLCAMVDSINKNREDHIITIEDPIEFTHDNQKCLVNQREVHNHTDSFKDALRAALREDPDILLVGEMRDLETISIAIETAETGHLVFGTLHTTTAASTVDRIIDQFPADRQQQVRVMLSESLRGVIAQTLLPKKGGGRVAALEVLIVTPAISNLIREGKTFQIPSAMQTGKSKGMVMLNDALVELVKKDLVEPRDAYIKAVDKTGFEMLLSRNGMKI